MTKEELIREAHARGYNTGVFVISTFNPRQYFGKIIDSTRCQGSGNTSELWFRINTGCNARIYNNGEWAKIIPDVESYKIF